MILTALVACAITSTIVLVFIIDKNRRAEEHIAEAQRHSRLTVQWSVGRLSHNEYLAKIKFPHGEHKREFICTWLRDCCLEELANVDNILSAIDPDSNTDSEDASKGDEQEGYVENNFIHLALRPFGQSAGHFRHNGQP